MGRHMKHIAVWTLLGAGVLVAGCAMTGDVAYLNERVAALEQLNKQTEAKNARLYSQMDEFSKQRAAEDRDLRSQNAGLRVLTERLREENRLLKGRVEEIENLVRGQGQAGNGLNVSLEQLNQRLAANTNRLIRLEQYMGFEPSEKMAVPSPTTSPSDAVEKKTPPDLELYALAKRSLDQGDLETARAMFARLLKQYPKSVNADNAQFWIGETYYQEKWYDKAILEYQDVIEKYPNGNKVAAAYLKQGFAFEKIGDKTNARLVLKELVRKFPKSKEATIAAEKIKTLQ